MKSLVTALVIAAVLFSGSIFYLDQLSDKSDELARITADIAHDIESENFEDADRKIAVLTSTVDDFEDFFLATGNHSEIDNIETALAELRAFSHGRSRTDALSQTNVLTFLFTHLPENSRLKIGNIL